MPAAGHRERHLALVPSSPLAKADPQSEDGARDGQQAPGDVYAHEQRDAHNAQGAQQTDEEVGVLIPSKPVLRWVCLDGLMRHPGRPAQQVHRAEANAGWRSSACAQERHLASLA